MTLINIHFTIQGLTPRYPFIGDGRNLISVRDQIAAAVLESLVSTEDYLIAIGPQRARRVERQRAANTAFFLAAAPPCTHIPHPRTYPCILTTLA